MGKMLLTRRTAMLLCAHFATTRALRPVMLLCALVATARALRPPAKIVVLDGYTATAGVFEDRETAWRPALRDGDELVVYDRTAPSDVVGRLEGASVAVVNKVLITDAVLSAVPSLGLMSVTATGVNNVDLRACGKRDVAVTNVPAYSTPSVAQHVMACALDFTNKVHGQSAAVKGDAWSNSPDFCCFPERTVEIAGSIFVVVGGGAIGAAVAAAAGALGADVRVVSARDRPALDAALAEADFLSLHVPLAAETENLVDAAFLNALKPSCCFINTARGPIVDEDALLAALNDETLAAAYLDVLVEEPPGKDSPGAALIAHPRCVVTPHTAWATDQARGRLVDTACASIAAFLRGDELAHRVGT